jgi:hypothetical protein
VVGRRDGLPEQSDLQVQRLQEEAGTQHPGDQHGRLQPQGHQYPSRHAAIKRKIDVEKIKAITVSKIGTEFIIHVPEEYDYR